MELETTRAGEPARWNSAEGGLRRMILVSAVTCAALMQTLDSTTFYVALPYVEGNFRALEQWRAHRVGQAYYFALSRVGLVALMARSVIGSLWAPWSSRASCKRNFRLRW